MIIIYISQRAWKAIEPRQIINYDAGIVLIDLHQLNVKTTSDNTNQRHWIQRQPHVNENRTHEITFTNIRFPNQMISKLTSLLSKKGQNFSAWVIEACRRRLTSKGKHTSIKSDEEWTSRVLPSRQDDIVNSLNYEGIAVIELQFLPLSWHWQTACWLCHRLNGWMISSYGDQSTTEIIVHIIIVLHQRCLNCSECFQRHLMFYTCNYSIRVTRRNGAIKHIFYTNQIHGGIIQQIVLYSFCRSMCSSSG